MSDLTLETTKAVIEKWTPIASTVPEAEPGAPIQVLTGEAYDLVYFIREHWEPAAGEKPRPGMREALISNSIPETIAQDLHELAVAVTSVHGAFRAVTASTLEAPVERGEFLLGELKQSLEFIFDDGVSDEQDGELARLSESHSDTRTHDALASSLVGFAQYAAQFRDRLAGLPEFDQAFIDEALVIAERLHTQSAIKLSSTAVERQAQRFALRNRLLTLLNERVARARRAARYVFRNHPELLRKVGSTYERKQRARRRAAKTEETAPESTSN